MDQHPKKSVINYLFGTIISGIILFCFIFLFLSSDFPQSPPLIPYKAPFSSQDTKKPNNQEEQYISQLEDRLELLEPKYQELEQASKLQSLRIKESIYIIFLGFSAIFFIKFSHSLFDSLKDWLDK